MLVHLRRSIAAALLLAGATILPSSCARDDSSIFIRGNLVVTRSDCSVTISTTPTLTFQGTIDAAYAGEYVATLLVENQIVSRGSATTLKTETSGVQLYEAEVQVLDPAAGGGAIAQFSVPVAGYIDPNMNGQDGAGGTEVIMIDAATIQNLSGKAISTGKEQLVVSSVVIKGRTLGGLEVHTQEFLYPVNVCVGCTCTNMGMACVGGQSSSASTGDCRLGIDEQTPCQIIAARGICGTLECTTPGDPTTAVCPSHLPPDMSCCP